MRDEEEEEVVPIDDFAVDSANFLLKSFVIHFPSSSFSVSPSRPSFGDAGGPKHFHDLNERNPRLHMHKRVPPLRQIDSQPSL